MKFMWKVVTMRDVSSLLASKRWRNQKTFSNNFIQNTLTFVKLKVLQMALSDIELVDVNEHYLPLIRWSVSKQLLLLFQLKLSVEKGRRMLWLYRVCCLSVHPLTLFLSECLITNQMSIIARHLLRNAFNPNSSPGYGAQQIFEIMHNRLRQKQ